MNKNWLKVPLSKVITHRKEFTQIDDLQEYKRCRVQLHAKGVVLRDIITGALIKTKKQQVCRVGEFLVAEIDAKVGGYGIVPEELKGAIVSSHYFLFTVDKTQLDRRFLDYFIRTPDFREQVTARGSTNYAAIRPKHVLNYMIPLPPISEQQRIVAKIEQLAMKVEEAQTLRYQSDQEIETLQFCQLHSTYDILLEKYDSSPLEELLIVAGYGTSTKCFYEKLGNSVPVLRIPNIVSERVNFNDLKFGVLTEKELSKVILNEGDLLVVRTNGSANLVGRCAVVSKLSEPTAFASYLIRLQCNPQIILPDYLQLILRYHRNSGHLFDFARTTAGQYNVSLGRLKPIQIPIPPIHEQRRIITYFDNLQTKIDNSKQFQIKIHTELDALLPSILDKAFKGEL